MPSVAVVIPLYKHEAYITAALDSLRAQTRPVDKIVVVDDGSSDGSVERVKGTGDGRIHLIEQGNTGAHAALSTGITAAEGCDYISILNSDDAYHPERIERCLEFLGRQEDCDVVCTRLHLIDEHGARVPGDDPRERRLTRLWRTIDPAARPARALGYANFVKTTSNLFGRREAFLRHPFRPYRYVHDYAFALRVALEQRLGVLDEELLLYRVHGTNTIKTGPAGELPRELLRMNFDLLRELAPQLQTSSDLRRATREYFQNAFGNHADFQAEPFLALVAKFLAGIPADELTNRLSTIHPAAFPELTAAPDPGLKEITATADLAESVRALLDSRWFALGRALGFARAPLMARDLPHQRLGAWKKALQRSRWLKLGRALGFYSDPFERHPS